MFFNVASCATKTFEYYEQGVTLDKTLNLINKKSTYTFNLFKEK